MKILDLQQGSPAWVAARVRYRCASEAPIVMGASRHMSRAQLIRMKATGGEKEFSDYVLREVLAKGIEAESAGILYAEGVFDEALFKATGVDDTETYLASFDGLSMAENRAAEVKLANQDLARMIAAEPNMGGLSPEYYWQLEHQMLVAGIQEELFVVTDGTPSFNAAVIYRSVPERRAQLIAGWDLFEQDVANYRHEEVLPPPPGIAPEALPELAVVLVGEVRSSNLALWRDVVALRIREIPIDLQTDQDFATAEKTIKFLEDGERKLAFAKSQALAQTVSIDELFKTVDALAEEMRGKRLTLDKLVKARKESIRAEIVVGGREAFAAHVATLNKRLGRPFMPTVLTDFPGVVKGLRTVQTLRDAVSGELARAKLIANEVADQIQANMSTLSEIIGDRAHLYPDFAQLVLKPHGDMVALARQRLAEADEKERKRAEAQREQIRIEEEAKARAAVTAARPERLGVDGLPSGHPRIYADEPPPSIGKAAPVATSPTGELERREAVVVDLFQYVDHMTLSQLRDLLEYAKRLLGVEHGVGA